MHPNQLAVFSWWLDQDPGKRGWREIQAYANTSEDQSQRWLGDFKKKLAEHSQIAVKSKLKAYVDSYTRVQAKTLESCESLLEFYNDEIEKIRKKPENYTPAKVKTVINGLKEIYDLTEKASLADVAKKSLTKTSTGNVEDLPENSISDLLEEYGISGQSTENPTDNLPENSSIPAEKRPQEIPG